MSARFDLDRLRSIRTAALRRVSTAALTVAALARVATRG